MSFMMSSATSGPGATGMPQGELVATYATYAQAREQVDKLASTDFPVSAVSIVGKDLRVVERVRGRLGYAQVALGAGLRGLLFGALIGLFLLLLNPAAGPFQIVTSALLGLAVWLIFGVVGFAMTRSQRDFASTQALVPAGYDLVVAFEHAARARKELGLGAGAVAPAAPAAGGSASAAPAVPTASGEVSGQAPVTPSSSGGSHAAGTVPGAGQVDPAGQGAVPAPGTAPDPDAPVGLDRSYGQSLPPEEVEKLIEARGGRKTSPPAPQDGR